jgi:hypothetical protein
MHDRRRLSVVVILSVVLMLCFAGSAFATTYCVGSAPNCTGTAEPDLQTALTEADIDTQGSDTIVLPAGTFSNTNSFYYDGHVPLEINGQGEGSTTLTLPSSSNVGYVLAIAAGAASATLRGFSVVIAATNSNGITAQVPTTVSNVKVTASGSSADAGIALYDGGTASNVNVGLPTVGNSAGLIADKTTTIDDSTLAATYGLEGTDDTIVHRSVISGGDGAAFSVTGGSQGYVDDSLIEEHGSGAALFAYESTLIGRQLTVVGDAESTGVEVSTGTNIGGAIGLSDSIIGEPLGDPFEIGGQAVGTITLDHSDYDHLDLPAGFVSGAGNLPAYAAPVFANAANGDYRLMASSPALLFGLDATGIQSGESSTDLTGLPRFNGAPRDLGAYQHQVPSVTAASATPQPASTGAAVTFAAAAATAEPTDPLSYRWSFDDGGSATGATVTHAFTSTGTHAATVTVTDTLGFTATKTISVAVNAAAAPTVTVTVRLGRASVSKQTDAITFAITPSATGTASVRATFVRTLRTVSGKGRHRKIKVVHRTVLFGTATAKSISAQVATTLKLTPSRSVLRLLKSLHRTVRVTVVVSFTPSGGMAQRQTFVVTLPKLKAR